MHGVSEVLAYVLNRLYHEHNQCFSVLLLSVKFAPARWAPAGLCQLLCYPGICKFYCWVLRIQHAPTVIMTIDLFHNALLDL